jgi:hypothetical protein
VRSLSILVALALLGSGCASESPSGQPVGASASPAVSVGSPTPAPTPATTATPTQAATPSPIVSASGEIEWVRLGTIDVPEAGGGFDVIGFDRGYLVLDEFGPLQFSADGVQWRSIRLPSDAGRALGTHGAATDGRTVVVVGGYTPCSYAGYNQNPFGSCRERPASWKSRDGRTWRVSDAWTGPVGPVGKSGSEFIDVWHLPEGRWEVAQIFSRSDDSDDLDPKGPTVWQSDDGRDWRGPSDGLRRSECPVDLFSYWVRADARGRRLAFLQCDDGYDLATSRDGQHYERLGGFPSGGWARPALAPTGSEPWLMGGARGNETQEPVIWSSTDLASWTTAVLPVPPGRELSSRVWALGLGNAGYVAGGNSWTTEWGHEAFTWVSHDGIEWRLADARSRQAISIEGIASGPAGVLGFGSVQVTEEVWRLDVWKLVNR